MEVVYLSHSLARDFHDARHHRDVGTEHKQRPIVEFNIEDAAKNLPSVNVEIRATATLGGQLRSKTVGDEPIGYCCFILFE